MDQKAWAWACTDLRSFEWSSVVARSGARAAVSRSKVRARQSPAVAFSRSSRSVLGLGATTALASRRRRVWRQAYGSGRVPGGRDGGRKGMNKGRDRPEACARLRCACGDLSESEPEGEGETSGGGSRSLPRFSKKEDAEGGTSVRVGVVAMGEERNDGTTRKRLRCVYDAWRRTWSQGLLLWLSCPMAIHHAAMVCKWGGVVSDPCHPAVRPWFRLWYGPRTTNCPRRTPPRALYARLASRCRRCKAARRQISHQN